MLEAKNLSFSYEKKSSSRKILKDVTLSVKPGERVGILAPSGAGKTTFLKILGGYLFPDSGCVLVDGKPLPKKGRCPVQLIWQHPEKYEKGYQTLQGLYAIGSGGLFGRGLGNSVQKLGFLPEAQNDMIFSIICEELGLVGAGIIIVLFLILIWRLFVIATKTTDLLGALIASGALAHMMIQVILNIAVVTNSIPNTGITLPFISYGGTSVMFLLMEMGLVLSVSSLVE